jgi:hypothetical protein
MFVDAVRLSVSSKYFHESINERKCQFNVNFIISYSLSKEGDYLCLTNQTTWVFLIKKEVFEKAMDFAPKKPNLS